MLIQSCTDLTNNVCDDFGSLYRKADFPVGVAINFSEFMSNPICQSKALQQFNRFTPENELKMESVHPFYNTFYFEAMDSLVHLSNINQKAIHGHTLIWHEQLPDWIITFNGSSQEWEILFKSHIQTIVKRYKGKIKSWDVVNEAFNEDGSLRQTIWLKHLGYGYIERAFAYAFEADPNALLFYNDYNLESNPNKRKAVINYFNNLKEEGTKVDGIGMQMHVSIDFPEMTQISEAFQDIEQTELLLHVSELDVTVNSNNQLQTLNSEILLKQAKKYSEIVALYNQLNTKNKFGITIWGMSDKDSWIISRYNRKDYPLLYDSAYSPKPAYCKFLETL